MEFQIHQRLLVITILFFLVFNCQHCKLVQNVDAETDFSPENAPNLQPVVSPRPQAESPDQELSPSPTSLPPLSHVSFPPSESYSPSDSFPPSESNSVDENLSPSLPPLNHVSFPPSESTYSPSDSLPPSELDSLDDEISLSLSPSNHVSLSPSEAYSPSDSLPPSESNSPDEEISPSISDAPSEAFAPSNFDDFSAFPPSANIDPKIKEICDSTDYPSLCLSSIVPFLNGRTDVMSVLEMSIKASNEYAKFALSMAKKVASIPGIPHQIVSILNDCMNSYEDVLYNFQNALTALPARDIGAMNSMLSAVITDAGDCEDGLNGANFPSPLSNFGEKLINMTSNCLAIVSLIH